jgi:Flp pilus assembly protein TadG
MRAISERARGRSGAGDPRRQVRARSTSGQATAEFALVIGVLIFIMLGVVDLGRLVAMQSAVVTASREGARYGSATGNDAAFSGTPRYRNCLGIKDAATKVSKALVTPQSVIVTWDAGPVAGTPPTNPAPKHQCLAANNNPPATGTGSVVKNDRVIVEVNATYSPISMIRFVIPSVTVQSIDRRTIVIP